MKKLLSKIRHRLACEIMGLIRRLWRRYAIRPSFKNINEFIFDCSLSGLGILNYQNEHLSGEKHFVEQLLPLYIGDQSPVMVDVGGNIGSYTRLLLEAFPNSLVWTFEPNPITYAALKNNFDFPNVVTENKGLGANDARLNFYDRKDSDGSSQHGSLYREVIEDLHGAESTESEVEITTLDDYAEKNEIKHIKLLKIDTEGHELEVLRGATNLLGDGSVDILHIEFNEMNIVSRVFFRDIVKALPDYVPFRLLPQGVIQLGDSPLRTELFAYQNLVFVHKKFEPNKMMEPTANCDGLSKA